MQENNTLRLNNGYFWLAEKFNAWNVPLMEDYPCRVDDLISLLSFRPTVLPIKMTDKFCNPYLFPFLPSTTPVFFSKPFILNGDRPPKSPFLCFVNKYAALLVPIILLAWSIAARPLTVV